MRFTPPAPSRSEVSLLNLGTSDALYKDIRVAGD